MDINKRRPDPGYFPEYNCSGCDIKISSPPFPGVFLQGKDNNKPTADIMFIGDSPKSDEVSNFRIFSNSAGEFIDPVFEAIQENGYNIYVTNACKCQSETGPTDKSYEHCTSNHLTQEISRYNPQLIICLGNKAIRALGIPNIDSVAKARRSILFCGDYPVMTTYHPGQHIYFTESNGKYGQDLRAEYMRIAETALKFLSGDLKQEEENINIVKDWSDLDKVADYVAGKKILSFDIETNQGKLDNNCTLWQPAVRLLCIGVAVDGNSSWVIPEKFIIPEHIQRITAGKTLLQSNVKYDIQGVEAKLGITLAAEGALDTQLINFLKNPNSIRNGLKAQVEDYLGIPRWNDEVYAVIDDISRQAKDKNKPIIVYEVLKTKNKGDALQVPPDILSNLKAGDSVWISGDVTRGYEVIKMQQSKGIKYIIQGELYPTDPDFGHVAEFAPDVLYKYNARDVMYCYRLYEYHMQHNKELLPEPIHGVLNRAIFTLKNIEKTGLPINLRVLRAVHQSYEQNIRNNQRILELFPAVQEAMSIAGSANVKSGPFKEALVRTTGVPILKQTKAGGIKVGKEVKGVYKTLHPAWDYFQRIEKDRTLLSNSIANIEKRVIPDLYSENVGWINTDFVMCKVVTKHSDESGGGTITGRLASRNPNLQNLAKEKGFTIMIEAPPGYCFMNFDYPQIELRIGAWMAKCESLMQMLIGGGDPYVVVAAKAYKIPESEVTDKQRYYGKRAVLSKMYGITAFELSIQLNIPEEDVQAIIDAFDEQFPDINEFMSMEASLACTGRPMVTPWGRHRTFEGYTGNEYNDARIDRQAGNNRIQSIASDITVKKANEIDEWLDENYELREFIRPCNIVHDSIWTLCKTTHLYLGQHIIEIMSDRSTLPFELPIPIDIKEIEIGYNMAYMTEIKVKPDYSHFEEARAYLQEAKCFG